MFNIDKAIAAWINTFKHSPHFFKEDIEELERHVRDSTASLKKRGFSEKEAFEHTIDVIGTFDAAETEYRKVYWQKLRFRGSLGQILLNRMIMFSTYMKLAGRNLLKHKLASFINLFGFSASIGCCLVLFSFIDIQYEVDAFHKNADRIFLVQHIAVDSDGSENMIGRTPVPLGPALKENIPQIERAARLAWGNTRMIYEDNSFNESIFFADPDVFEMFSYPFKYGDKTAFSERNVVVFTEEMAEKYFGRTNPVGEQLTLSFGEHFTESFTVAGVLEKIPNNRSWQTNFFLPYENMFSLGIEENDWQASTTATTIQLNTVSSIEAVEAQLDRYVSIHNAVNVEMPMKAFFLDNLLKLSLHSHRVRDSLPGGSSPQTNIVIGTIGLFILLLAAFNYVNIAIASAARRFKEIGIRKVVGSTKSQLVSQFLSENMLLCLIALLGGILLAESFLLPGFNQIFAGTGAPEFRLDYLSNIRIWIVLACLLLIIGIGSGAYPAFYISSFNPVSIFRGRQQLSGKKLLSRSFVTIQFTLTFILVVIAVGITQNQIYQNRRSWGYDPAHTIVVPVEGYSQYATLRNDLSQFGNVTSLAGSRSSLGRSRSRRVVTSDTTSKEVTGYAVGPAYIETMGLQMVAGRPFENARQAENAESVVVNEALVEDLGWDNPLDRTIISDSIRYNVIGVVKNFQENAFFDTIGPAVFFVTPEENYRYLSVSVQPGTEITTNHAIEDRWDALIPDMDYPGYLQRDVFEEEYNRREREVALFIFIGLMALVLSCMGILGLVSLAIARRMKDLSIHKVLGASSMRVAHLINREFIYLVGIAMVVASPASYYLLRGMLVEAYTDPIPLGFSPFFVSIMLVFGALAMTISSQVYRASVSNPVGALQSE